MTKPPKIVFPEWDNPIIQQAIQKSPQIEAVPADNLNDACHMVKAGQAQSLIAGIDYTSRDVIIACRDHLGTKGKTFSSCFVLTKGKKCYIMSDAATCKNPTEEQLFDITMQTYDTASAVLPDGEVPRIALLNFSTAGSGGKDPSITRAQAVIQRVHTEHPEILIDGEMQLDAAVVPEVGQKKFPDSRVAGHANVWIVPDINSGNILYKAMERFGGFTAAGPILQGFNAPCSDLSRGSTVADVMAVIEVEQKLIVSHEKL